MPQKSVALALGSGGSRGYSIIPIIQRLEKEQISISAISGSSVGSLIGAYYALHGEINSMLKIIKEMDRKKWLRLVDPNNPKKSLMKGHKIKQFMIDHYFGNATFADTKIPLVVCTTDFLRSKTVYINKGKIVDAVMASICIPGVFPPYRIGDSLYIDGGVLDSVPTKPLFDMGCTKIVAVNLTKHAYSRSKEDFGLISTMLDTIYMMMETQARKKASKRLFVLEPVFNPEGSMILQLSNWEHNYNLGLKAINQQADSLLKWLDK
jgi:NTE family protein